MWSGILFDNLMVTTFDNYTGKPKPPLL